MTLDPTTPPAVEAHELVRAYGRDRGLDGASLTLPQGSVTLLAGPNGSGKTTLLSLLLDLRYRDSGHLKVFGLDPAEEGARVRALAGYLPEHEDDPFGHLRVEELFALEARLRPGWDPGYARALSKRLELRPRSRVSRLSKGEARRVRFALTLAHRPPLLLLDEPTDGLDPVVRSTVLGTLAEHLADTGATAIYATHHLEEAQGLADHLAVLRHGTVRVCADTATLHATHFRVRWAASPEGSLGPDAASGTLAAAGIRRLQVEHRSPAEVTATLVGSRDAILAWAQASELEVRALDPLSLAQTAFAWLAPPSNADPSTSTPIRPVPEGATP